MFALSVEAAKRTAVIVAIVFLGLAVIAAGIVKNMTIKIVTIALLAAIALGFYTQRHALDTCVSKAKALVENGSTDNSCSFFGFEIKVPIPKVPGSPTTTTTAP